MTRTLSPVYPETVDRWLAAGEAVLVDIREPMEHAREHVPGAISLPLSTLDAGAPALQDRVVVFHCKSGGRTQANAARLAAVDCRNGYVLEGGIDAWKRAGLPVAVDRRAPIDLQRQVMIAAGSLVLLGLALAVALSPWFIAVDAFVGAGMVVAGVTGFCGMARILAAMPWNRVPAR
ncbi:MAG: rhodanese-like domain-containing protein [Gemmatimonas sp.]